VSAPGECFEDADVLQKVMWDPLHPENILAVVVVDTSAGKGGEFKCFEFKHHNHCTVHGRRSQIDLIIAIGIDEKPSLLSCPCRVTFFSSKNVINL
jgi:hypothetical protein